MPSTPVSPSPADVVSLYRSAQQRWAAVPVAHRCRAVAAARHRVAAAADRLVAHVASPQRADASETIAAELIPLCDALRFIGRRGPRVLATRRLGVRDRPLWLAGIYGHVQRAPRGVVLVIGTWNYPLLLSGVQIAQALAAGNAVLCKPAPGCEAATEMLADCFIEAGVPQQCLTVLGSDVEAATGAIASGVDFIVLTGSAATGRRVLAQAAEHLTPATMELSGCDAMVVLKGSDPQLTSEAVRFGLTVRSGATCIAPRRIIAVDRAADQIADRLRRELADCGEAEVHPAARPAITEVVEESLRQGGVDLLGSYDGKRFATSGRMRPVVIVGATAEMPLMQQDVFGPVAALCSVPDAAAAVGLANRCRYALGASVFGPHTDALRVADQLQVGSVTVNDLIAPTADPRVPFGGRRESGFGVTRGPEGLLDMTVPRVVSIRRRGRLPHLEQPNASTGEILAGALQIQHGDRWSAKWSGLRRLIRGVRLTRIRSRQQFIEE